MNAGASCPLEGTTAGPSGARVRTAQGSACAGLWIRFSKSKGGKREEKNPFPSIDGTPVPEYALQHVLYIKNLKRGGDKGICECKTL